MSHTTVVSFETRDVIRELVTKSYTHVRFTVVLFFLQYSLLYSFRGSFALYTREKSKLRSFEEFSRVPDCALSLNKRRGLGKCIAGIPFLRRKRRRRRTTRKRRKNRKKKRKNKSKSGATPPMRELALHRVSSFARMDLHLNGVACQCARARVSVLRCDCCK